MLTPRSGPRFRTRHHINLQTRIRETSTAGEGGGGTRGREGVFPANCPAVAKQTLISLIGCRNNETPRRVEIPQPIRRARALCSQLEICRRKRREGCRITPTSAESICGHHRAIQPQYPDAWCRKQGERYLLLGRPAICDVCEDDGLRMYAQKRLDR